MSPHKVDETTSNAEELAAFLYLLDMSDKNNDDESDGSTSTSPWTVDVENEKIISANFIKSLSTQDLEAEFLRQFRTHLVCKQFLSGPEAKAFKDRVFLLMAKEQEAGQTGNAAQQILYGHFLYDELRLQHQFVTTPQVRVCTYEIEDISRSLTLLFSHIASRLRTRQMRLH